MNRLIFATAILAIVGVAAWAYHINYRTKTTLREIDALRSEIGTERERLQVLRVEWAYLNNPERLARLVALNNDALGLVPIAPDRFGHVAAVPFPPRETVDPLEAALAAAVASGAYIPGAAPASGFGFGPAPAADGAADALSVAAGPPLPPPRPGGLR